MDEAERRIRRARAASPPPAADRPVFRLVRKDPPVPPPKPRKPGLSDRMLPLLADIDAADLEWWSVAECPTPRSAAVMATRCRKLGIPGWEWKAADGEVYVRRAER
jgi:hypothetical protein